MIEVLWIDDECLEDSGELSITGKTVSLFAKRKGINITPIAIYQDGVDAIRNNPQKWCAVILDIHNQKATTGSPSDDFAKAKDDIKRIQWENHQEEPYIFVLSGNKQYHTESSTLRKPDYGRKNVYDKSTSGYEILFEDILNIQNVSPFYKCQSEYSDVLVNAKEFCGEDTWKRLLSLLYKITIKNAKDPSLFNDMRKVFENIMSGLKGLGYSYFTEKDKISLNDLSIYVGNDSNVPEYIKRSFHTVDRIVQDGSHSKNDYNSRLQVDSDVLNGRAPYLLRSCLYELCNILIWMRTLV